MAATIVVEGVKVRGTVIARERLLAIWKRLTGKPLPRVVAFQVEDDDFDSLMRSRKCWNDVAREMQEWGRVLSAKGTDACVFNADEFEGFDYVILIRMNPYHELNKVLEHELSHIVKGDL